MKTILITGGSGLIGTHLTEFLTGKGFAVHLLSRKKRESSTAKYFLWDVGNAFIDDEAIALADVVIHLAGENIGEKRWTEKRKKEIIHSRVKSTTLIAEKLNSIPNKVSVFISASATGFYGNTGEKWISEGDAAGNDFLAQTCAEWERVVNNFSSSAIRTVIIRNGFVLSNNGGAFPKLVQPIRNYAGAVLASGKQYIPWIHIEDLCRVYLEAIENNSFQGAINAVAPNPVTNKAMTHAIAKQLKRPLLLPAVPAWALKLILGEMAMLVTTGCKASAEKLKALNFKFRYERIEDALKNLY